MNAEYCLVLLVVCCAEIWRIFRKALCRTALFNMLVGVQPATRWFVCRRISLLNFKNCQ